MGPSNKYTSAIKYDFTNGKIFRKRRSDNKWEEIGSPNKAGYLTCSINGKRSTVHRILYEKYYCIELTPDIEIDHIDNNRSNNTIKNLRAVSRSQNKENKKCRKDNKLGHKNISLCNKTGRYIVQIQVNGKLKYYDRFIKLEDAIAKRDETYIELNKQGHIFSC
jgi:hypothetical protein